MMDGLLLHNTAKSSWWQPTLKFLYSIPNSVGSLFTSLIHDWHEFIQTNEQGSITTNVGEYENRKDCNNKAVKLISAVHRYHRSL